MKRNRKSIALLVAAAMTAAPALAAAPAGRPGAFPGSEGGPNTKQYHSYDGLICTDCHTLHNSEGGAKVATTGGWGAEAAYRELLKKGDWTDMCLSCHKQGYNTSATADLVGVENSGWIAPIVMTNDGIVPGGIAMPAGDFYWSNLDPKKGHNPSYTKGSMTTATSKLIQADSVLGSTPPGGSITDGEWSCHSCHGMHARFSDSYGAWRQLKRKVNNKNVSGDVTSFGVETIVGNVTQDAAYEPIKSNSRGDIVGNDYLNVRKDLKPLEGADLFQSESDTNKNVYRGGFSSFCAACHGDFHGGNGETRTTDNGKTRVGGTWLKHPTNVKMNEAGSKYGISTYTKQVTNTQSTAPNPVGYDWRYPLVQPDSDFTVKVDVASMGDALTAIGDDRIMCLTCHKAHATKFENMVRWDANAHAFLPNGTEDPTGTAYAAGDNIAFGCGKCHQKGGAKAFVKAF
ncbi:MAG: hypothetical protein HY900_16055 [Deltaproteobacteria bacterium]|nr:hypothetical protein [Deltaproteobacteria bacterium]